ncbi:unnamed protein product [Onchocerca flexuosa]|uniref:Copper transporter n=1 Tax=Onchocerca flexuosa TaxID=387005 RepID=A0A183I295_9BILA|nr:unnamed protein product [Onchocerca flexuosa]
MWNGDLPGGSVVSWLSAYRTTAIITAVLCFVEAFQFRILLLKRNEYSIPRPSVFFPMESYDHIGKWSGTKGISGVRVRAVNESVGAVHEQAI